MGLKVSPRGAIHYSRLVLVLQTCLESSSHFSALISQDV